MHHGGVLLVCIQCSVSKDPLTYTEQLELLESWGLVIDDRHEALQSLADSNYYRLSIYGRAFTKINDHHRFRNGVTFKDILTLYNFDRELRKLVNEACKRLEISARSRWAYELAQAYGPQAYEDPPVFSHAPSHVQLLKNFDLRFARSSEDFAQHYKLRKCSRPEVWVAIELFDFGLFRKFYSATKRAQDRERVARHSKLPEPVFASILTNANELRNVCAHHSRLWNRKLARKVSLPKKAPDDLLQSLRSFDHSEDLESRKIYNSLVLIHHINDLIDPQSNWLVRLLERLRTLLEAFIMQMGFPNDWKSRPGMRSVKRS